MIRAVLLDLDDTLITTHTEAFHKRYLGELGLWMAERLGGDPAAFIEQLLAAYQGVLTEPIPLRTLFERTMQHFAAARGVTQAELLPHFDAFYAERYPQLVTTITPRPPTTPLLDFLHNAGIQIVIATNPGLPIESIHQRMRAGGLEPDRVPVTFITSMRTMHFGKPLPAYYAEIALRLQLNPSQLLMVGDDPLNDMQPAQAAGLHTFHVTPSPQPDEPHAGTWSDFVDIICQGGLSAYPEHALTPTALMARMRAFPSVVAGLVRPIPPERIDQCPAENEWSLRDIVYHLADYEIDQNQPKLQRIVTEDNPFLSGEYDPWDKAVDYGGRHIQPALQQFAQRRAGTLAWLNQQASAVWQRPARSSIFGPTTFHEVVRFITEHDSTHHQQMHDAIACITAGMG